MPSFVVALDSGLQIQLRTHRPSERVAQLIDAVPAEVVVLGATAVERAGDIHRNRLGHGIRLVIGLDRLEPLLWDATKHLLENRSRDRTLVLLDDRRSLSVPF